VSARSTIASVDSPQQADLDKCVHCGLCLNSCPTYRELGLEMDSPRGRIYQMVQVREGRMDVNDDYVRHIELCLACRACESACPSGVQYGKLVEAARGEIAAKRPAGFLQRFLYEKVLLSPALLKFAGYQTLIYQKSGLQALARKTGILKLFGRLGKLEALAPPAQYPFFFSQIGKTFPAKGEKKHRVAMMAGCIANVSFARMNEATVRVLQRNGCEVVLPGEQVCCGALHVHAGMRGIGRQQALRNMRAIENGGFDAVITNAAGCGSTLKEYHELFEHGSAEYDRARAFTAKVKDVSEFLASIDFNRNFAPTPRTVTYQDSCHLLHGQKVRNPPRELLRAIPELRFKELPLTEICCGSAGVYNVQHTEMSMALLENKMKMVESTGADLIVTANPGCMLQLEAGGRLFSKGQQVMHVIELLDDAYRRAEG
jgi:glycolate oxidase iron-sulfur subunit